MQRSCSPTRSIEAGYCARAMAIHPAYREQSFDFAATEPDATKAATCSVRFVADGRLQTGTRHNCRHHSLVKQAELRRAIQFLKQSKQRSKGTVWTQLSPSQMEAGDTHDPDRAEPGLRLGAVGLPHAAMVANVTSTVGILESEHLPQANQNPEQLARDQIDARLSAAGCQSNRPRRSITVQRPGSLSREYQTDIGPADYALFAEKHALGVVEAKPDSWGDKITTVELQSAAMPPPS